MSDVNKKRKEYTRSWGIEWKFPKWKSASREGGAPWHPVQPPLLMWLHSQVYQVARAAITKHRELGGFSNKNVWSLGSGDRKPNSRCQHGWFPLRGYEGRICSGPSLWQVTDFFLCLLHGLPSIHGYTFRFPLCIKIPVIPDYRLSLPRYDLLLTHYICNNSISR